MAAASIVSVSTILWPKHANSKCQYGMNASPCTYEATCYEMAGTKTTIVTLVMQCSIS